MRNNLVIECILCHSFFNGDVSLINLRSSLSGWVMGRVIKRLWRSVVLLNKCKLLLKYTDMISVTHVYIYIYIYCQRRAWSRNKVRHVTVTQQTYKYHCVGDRPFNLHGRGTMGVFFVQKFFFRSTRELEYLFFLSRKARNFFQESKNIRLYDQNSESDYFFFPPPKSEYFFSNIGNQNIFLEKKPYPPWKLNGGSLTEKGIRQVWR